MPTKMLKHSPNIYKLNCFILILVTKIQITKHLEKQCLMLLPSLLCTGTFITSREDPDLTLVRTVK